MHNHAFWSHHPPLSLPLLASPPNCRDLTPCLSGLSWIYQSAEAKLSWPLSGIRSGKKDDITFEKKVLFYISSGCVMGCGWVVLQMPSPLKGSCSEESDFSALKRLLFYGVSGMPTNTKRTKNDKLHICRWEDFFHVTVLKQAVWIWGEFLRKRSSLLSS